MRRPPLDLSVYLVTDTQMCGGLGVAETVRRAVASGVTVVQLRDPMASDADFVALGRAVRDVLVGSEVAGSGVRASSGAGARSGGGGRSSGVRLIVNDRVHLVAAIGADGAHVGQGDLDVASARDMLGPDAYLGLSVHTLEELAAARSADPDRVLIDYLGIGPLRETASKLDHKPVRGLAHLRALTEASPWPCVAIGGVKAADAVDLRGAGLQGMAVISAICGQADIEGATRELVTAWQQRPESTRQESARQESARQRSTRQESARQESTRPPVALSIAGSDPSGGAGIQADLKTFSALGAYGTCVITALTAQNTTGVTGVHQVPPAFVAQQLDTLIADVRLDAVKIGMLASGDLARLVASYLTPTGSVAGGPAREAAREAARDTAHETARDATRDATRATEHGTLAGIPVVLDPVMVATSGARLLPDDAVAAIREMLPLASLVTPNLPEASVLTGLPPASTIDGMRVQARALRDLGAARVLLKGGHLSEREDAVDLWLDDEGEEILTATRVPTRNTHGTGCTLSSAITALRPQRATWLEAARDAKAWLTQALIAADGLDIGHGPGPVHHFHEDIGARWRG